VGSTIYINSFMLSCHTVGITDAKRVSLANAGSAGVCALLNGRVCLPYWLLKKSALVFVCAMGFSVLISIQTSESGTVRALQFRRGA
jgi:hypothetical protein